MADPELDIESSDDDDAVAIDFGDDSRSPRAAESNPTSARSLCMGVSAVALVVVGGVLVGDLTEQTNILGLRGEENSSEGGETGTIELININVIVY